MRERFQQWREIARLPPTAYRQRDSNDNRSSAAFPTGGANQLVNAPSVPTPTVPIIKATT